MCDCGRSEVWREAACSVLWNLPKAAWGRVSKPLPHTSYEPPGQETDVNEPFHPGHYSVGCVPAGKPSQKRNHSLLGLEPGGVGARCPQATVPVAQGAHKHSSEWGACPAYVLPSGHLPTGPHSCSIVTPPPSCP